MPSEKEMSAMEDGKTIGVDSIIGTKAKILGFYMRNTLLKLQRYNICCTFITHIGKKLDMSPYATYDGRLASLRDYSISGGKAIQYFPSVMLWLRSRLTNKNDEDLEKMGIVSGFVVEASTLKSKDFSFDITIPLVFDTMRGLNEYGTRFINMRDDDWFGGNPNAKTLRTLPDVRFNTGTFFNKLNSDPNFKLAVDNDWKLYLDAKYGKYQRVITDAHKLNQEFDGISNNLNEDVLDKVIDNIDDDAGLLNSVAFRDESKPDSPGYGFGGFSTPYPDNA
jgi:hypothetical protein